MSAYGPRNFGLDLVRALAILMVLLAHGRALLPVHWERKWFAIGGFFGVELFFVLSGLLVGGILLRLYARQAQSGTGTWPLMRGFWIRRWFRTLPNYFLFLTLNITLFQWLFGPQEYDWRYFLLLQNLAWPSPPMMPEAWSLAVEEWFYLSLPLFFAAFLLLPVARPRALLIAALAYIGLFTLLRFGWALEPGPSWGAEVRRVVALRLDAIGYGVLIAYLLHFHPEWTRRRSGVLGLAGLAATVLALALYIDGVILGPVGWQHRTLLFSIAGAGLALLLPWFAELRCRSRAITSAILFVSTTSYAMYLIHLSFAIPLARDYIAPHFTGWIWPYVCYLALTVIASALVYRYFEHPITNLREHFRSKGLSEGASFAYTRPDNNNRIDAEEKI